MQPQNPNDPNLNPQVPPVAGQPFFQQPVAAQPVAPIQQPQAAVPPQQAYPGYQQPYGVAATSLPFPIISIAAGALSVVLFGIMYGIGFLELKYYLFLVPLVVAGGGVFAGMKSVKEGSGTNILALVGLIVSLAMASMSLSFTIGHGMLNSKAHSTSSYETSL